MEIREYVTRDGRVPFASWLTELKDKQARARIRVKLDRIRLGSLGDCKTLGNGVYELRVHFGPGYRIYFGKDSRYLVLLLCGGDKSTQQQDIKKAKRYWQDYRSRTNGKE